MGADASGCDQASLSAVRDAFLCDAADAGCHIQSLVDPKDGSELAALASLGLPRRDSGFGALALVPEGHRGLGCHDSCRDSSSIIPAFAGFFGGFGFVWFCWVWSVIGDVGEWFRGLRLEYVSDFSWL